MIELFIDYIDSLFYEGYAYYLAQTNPRAYTFELNQFLNNYNFTDNEQ